MDLPALWTIPFFAWKLGLSWHRNGLNRTNSMLAYGQCGWHAGWLWPSTTHPEGKPVLDQDEQVRQSESNTTATDYAWGYKNDTSIFGRKWK